MPRKLGEKIAKAIGGDIDALKKAKGEDLLHTICQTGYNQTAKMKVLVGAYDEFIKQGGISVVRKLSNDTETDKSDDARAQEFLKQGGVDIRKAQADMNAFINVLEKFLNSKCSKISGKQLKLGIVEKIQADNARIKSEGLKGVCASFKEIR